MKRRTFIHLSAFTTAAISLPLLNSCGKKESDHGMAHPVFLSRLFDEETVRDVGIAYLKKEAGENSKEKLIELLTENSAIKGSSDEKAIHEYLDGKIKMEFQTGKTILVKGWVLALTEARQCALFSIIRR